MLEYLILFIFIGLFFYPLQMDLLSKTMELILVVYAGHKSPLVGVFCAFVMMYNMTVRPRKVPEIEATPLPVLLEAFRPQDSNRVPISGTKENEHVEAYSTFNV